MTDMSPGGFQQACDALSGKIDAEQFERFRWSRDEAPKLARMVELIKNSTTDRSDIDINEEGGVQDSKRFLLKVHGKRIAGLAVALDRGHAVMSIGPAERSEYSVASGDPIHTEYANVDETWIGETLARLMERIGR